MANPPNDKVKQLIQLDLNEVYHFIHNFVLKM